MSNKNLKIKVSELCGPHCVGLDEGERLFQQVYPVLNSGGNIELDFSDILTLTSAFLNASIGKLFGHIEDKSFEGRMKVTGLDSDDLQVLQIVIKNAKEHFAKTKESKKLENDILKDISDDQR